MPLFEFFILDVLPILRECEESDMDLKRLTRTLTRRFGYDLVRYQGSSSMSSHLSILFPKFGINCVIDVGGHFGEYGRMLRENGYDGRIVSFEPVEMNHAKLLAASSRDKYWIVKNLALGEHDGESTILVTEGTGLDSFLTPSEYGRSALGNAMHVARQENVRVATLDAMFAECVDGIDLPRVYLKLDTQGWDINVLKGATDSIGKVSAMQSEVSVKALYEGMSGWTESLSYIQGLGFEMSGIFPVLQDPEFRAIELDVVMVRAR
jgi:FkbM family methyltransferase